MQLPRNAQLWLPGLLASRWRQRREDGNDVTDVVFCIADHFEPGHGNPGLEVERARVARWVHGLPTLGDANRDAGGYPPRHTFFFPAEQYRPEHIDALARLCERGFAELEIHLHHDDDTSDGLRTTLEEFVSRLARDHGLLGTRPDGSIAYGFIHGNWALDNARPDGRYCGVNDELTVLRTTGCYADFTLPAAPDASQTRVVNQLYYAIDDPARPRSHDRGVEAAVGVRPDAESLLMVQGPLVLDWERRRYGVLPGLDVAAIDGSSGYGPSLRRFRGWVDAGISVKGQPHWVFVKTHTHGATEHNAATLLGNNMAAFHRAIGRAFNDGRRCRLHYVTAREMVNILHAAEAGKRGNAGDYRNFVLRPPQAAQVRHLAGVG